MHNYKTARTIFGFFEFVSWALVVVGVFVLLAGMGGGASISRNLGGSNYGAVSGALPGIFVMLVGIFFVMLVQVCRATVDTAEMTGKLLMNSNEELKLLKTQRTTGLSKSRPADETGSMPASKRSASHVGDNNSDPKPSVGKHLGERIEPTITTEISSGKFSHNGKVIEIKDDGAYVGMLRFDDLGPAKTYIDEKLIPHELAAKR